MVKAIRLQSTANITATCHLSQINVLSPVQFSTLSLLPNLCWSL